MKGRLVSLRGKTRELDVWPYRVDFGTGPTPADACADTTPLQTLCRYYFFVRPDGRVKLEQLGVDLQGDVRLGGLQHKLLVALEHHETRKSGLQ